MYTEDRVYHHRVEMIDGKKHYFISFVDVHGDKVSVEVSEDVYEASQGIQRNEARIARSDRRHREHISLSDREIDLRVANERESVEKTLFQNECANAVARAIDALPQKQRKYFLLSRVEGMTVREIASREGSHFRTVHYSVKCAEKKVREIYKKYFKEF